MKKIFLFIFFLLNYVFCFTQCNGRYETEIFNNVNKTTVTYSNVYNLQMDIYQPDGDIEANRPVIIFMHSGSFTSGTRDMSDMVALCESFAKRGYVTASIDYRLNPDPTALTDSISIMTTVIEDISDAKAAIRYFRQDYSNGDNYKIDSSQIFIGGYSAGGIIAVNLAYLDNPTEAPQFLQNIISNNGGIEGNSGNPGYSSKVKAVINIAGAVYKPYIIDVNDEPIVSVHAAVDGVVPYDCDEVYWSGVGAIFNLVTVCGSQVIHNKANQLGIQNDLLEFSTGDHAAFLNNISQSINFISDFIYTTLDCYQLNSLNENTYSIEIYPNPVIDYLHLDTKGHNVDFVLFNNLGQLILEGKYNSNSRIDFRQYNKGLYLLQLSYDNKLKNQILIK